MRCYSRASRALSVLGAALLCVMVWAADLWDSLQEADRALQEASRARPADRKVFLKRAERALAPLSSEARQPLQDLLTEAAASGELADIARAQRSLRAYNETLEPPPAQPSTAVSVHQQLEAIFAEPDMQIPPKSLMERLLEAFTNGLEAFLRWLSRLFGGLGGARGGGLAPLMQWIVITLLVLTIALAISYLATRVRFRRRARAPFGALDALPDDARVLPSHEWRQQAQRLAAEGKWQLAARAYYLGTLRLLQEAKLLDYDPALTNWEHLQRLRQPPLAAVFPISTPLPDPNLREEAYHQLRPLTQLFDSLWYGRTNADEAIYHQFEAGFETLYRRLEAHAVPA